MKVSIITVCFNRFATIEKSILSVVYQDYPDIEYIVIDGASTDGTQAIIQQYAHQIDTFISEPDQGMYDAINKGLTLATGDIIGLMHSDDVFFDTKVVSKIVSEFNQNLTIDGVYGDGIYVSNDAEERIIRNRIGGKFSLNRIKKGWLPLHPTVYLKRKVIAENGFYNTDFKLASDTEFLLRYLFEKQIKMEYLNIYVVKMRMGGASTSFNRAFQILKEDVTIYRKFKIPVSTVFFKKIMALHQYIKS